MEQEQRKVVVFDDKCPACTVGMEFAESHDADSALKFVGINTEEGKMLIKKHDLDVNASAYVLHEDGSRAEKSAMMAEILSHNGFLGMVLSLPFRVPIVGNWLYYVFRFAGSVTRYFMHGTTNRLK
jgi:predicted DCC family thiol-disulfide oxidoreductase YuxK